MQLQGGIVHNNHSKNTPQNSKIPPQISYIKHIKLMSAKLYLYHIEYQQMNHTHHTLINELPLTSLQIINNNPGSKR